MKEYKIPVTWATWGEHKVKADSLEEAIKQAEEDGLPYVGQYIDDSYEVDLDAIEDANNELNKRDKIWLNKNRCGGL